MLIPIGWLDLHIRVLSKLNEYMEASKPTWTKMQSRVGVLGWHPIYFYQYKITITMRWGYRHYESKRDLLILTNYPTICLRDTILTEFVPKPQPTNQEVICIYICYSLMSQLALQPQLTSWKQPPIIKITCKWWQYIHSQQYCSNGRLILTTPNGWNFQPSSLKSLDPMVLVFHPLNLTVFICSTSYA